MKKFKEKYNFYALTLIIVVMIIGGWNSCQAQEKQYPQKIILEMELEQSIKITIPKIEELNKIYCDKFDTDYMILDEVNEIIKVVHFTGPGKTIHEHNAQWIEEHWK